VARVPRRESFALEHVTEVPTASCTLDLDPLSIRVRYPTDRSGDLLVEGGPAAVGIELGIRPVERCPAALAFVRAGNELALVLSRERSLGPLVEDHLFLRPCQGSKRELLVVGHEVLMDGFQ